MKKNRRLRISRETVRILVETEVKLLNQAAGDGRETNDRTCYLDTCRCSHYCPWTGGCG